MNKHNYQIKKIINNIFFTMPNVNEINKINLIVEKIISRKYRKIIFYAVGSSYAIINCHLNFYKTIITDFQLELINSFDEYIEQYFLEEILKNNLIIFCSRSGETYEINHQLSLLLQKQSLILNKIQNIVICTNIENNNLRQIANKFNLETISIMSGICARFEPFNAIYFLTIKLLNPLIDLIELKNKIKEDLEITYENKWNFNSDSYKDFFGNKNQIIVVFNNNFLLNGLVEWFKHLWCESFGIFDFNIKLEDHSSLFHSAIEYYANHQNSKYFLFFFNLRTNHSVSNLNTIISLLNPSNIINFTVSHLSVILIELIQYLFLLSQKLQINIFVQPHVDFYKNSFNLKNKAMMKLL